MLLVAAALSPLLYSVLGLPYRNIPAFTVLQPGGLPVELIGPRALRRSAKGSNLRELEQRLQTARRRHRYLSTCISSHGIYCWGAVADEVRLLKKRRLLQKDLATRLVSDIRRLRAAEEIVIGGGAFGRVLLGSSSNGTLVAIKIVSLEAESASHKSAPENQAAMSIQHAAKVTSLRTEAHVLQTLWQTRARGFARPLYFGKQMVRGEQSEVLVQELLGPSIETLWWASTGGTRFSAPCVLRIGIDALRCLQRLHAAGFTHNDVTPNNMCVGSYGDNAVRLVDLGNCEAITAEDAHELTASKSMLLTDADAPGRFDCPARLKACVDANMPFNPAQAARREFRGTPLFASVAAHAGAETTALSDIEALVYCLLFLVQGTLPWEGEFELVTIRELKESSLLGFVVDKTPEQAAFAFEAIGKMLRRQELRHELYIGELQAAYRAMSPQSSLTQPFDWELMGITWSANGTVFASDGTVIHAISKHVPTRPDAALW